VTAVLAAAARVVLEVILVLAAVVSVFWAAVGPQGFVTVVWLAVMFVVVTGAGLGVAAMQPRKGGGGDG
jgi:uncharacterized membrane protein